MRKLGSAIAAAVLGLSWGAARADGFTFSANGQVMTFEQRRHDHHFDEDDAQHQAAMDPDPLGRTRLKILAPEGAIAHLYRGASEIYADDIPTVVDVAPREHYRLVIAFPNGATWEHRVEVKPGHVLRLWVGGPPVAVTGYPPPGTGTVVVTTTSVQPPPQAAPPQVAPGPSAIDPGRFDALKRAISNESFPQQQLSVLRTAAARDYFSVEQVGQLVDLYSFPHDKVEAVRLTRAHVVDPENAYNLSSHFDFPNDKTTVQQMFQ